MIQISFTASQTCLVLRVYRADGSVVNSFFSGDTRHAPSVTKLFVTSYSFAKVFKGDSRVLRSVPRRTSSSKVVTVDFGSNSDVLVVNQAQIVKFHRRSMHSERRTCASRSHFIYTR